MTKNRRTKAMYFDGNGCLTEVVDIGGQHVVAHYDDFPESDITTVRGFRCTTPLRTVIDIAPDTPEPELRGIIHDLLDRGEFTVEEAAERLAQPDMASRQGAHMVRRILFG